MKKGAELDETPKVDELFVMSVQQSIELANMLGLSREQYVKMLRLAWDVDADRRKKEKE